MASSSDSKASNSKARSQSEDGRAALPFEPGRRRKENAADEDGAAQKSAQKKTAQKNAQKKGRDRKKQKASESDNVSDNISAGAQARVDAIRAANRKKANAKAKQKNQRNDGLGNNGPDSDGSIPKEVSSRMLRRMAILSMGPIALGVGIFFLSYYLLSRNIVEFAPVVVLLTTMGCFGLGVVGLTYGMLSASWDEEPGSFVGFSEFKLNLGRMVDAWKASRASKT